MSSNITKRFEKHELFRTLSIVIVVLMLFTSIISSISYSQVETSGEEIDFTILHTNDEHSSIIPHSSAVDHDPEDLNDPTIGGFARLATAINDVRDQKEQEGEPVLLFNAGDFLGGSPFGWLAPREGLAAELHLMQEMRYDAVAIGNHEYDYGTDVLAEYLIDAGYPDEHERTAVLASNTEPSKDHLLAQKNLFRDTAIFQLEERLSIGVFSLIGKDAVSVTPDPENVTFQDQHETSREMVERLRDQGADIIVALTHSGVKEDKELARDVDGIDIIVGGHCHTALYEPEKVDGTIIVQAGSLVRYLGNLELAYNFGTEKVRIRNFDKNSDFLIPIDNRFYPDEHISDLVQNYKLELDNLVCEMTDGRFDDILGTIATSDFSIHNHPPSEETPVGNFITDGMRLVTGEVTQKRVDIALQANGNIRESIVPGSMPHCEGNISFYDIADVIGLGYGEDGYAGYPIVSFYLTGDEIRRALEIAVLLEEFMSDTYFLQFSGIKYEYNPNNAVLFTIPFMDLPIPTGRAVTSAHLYTGDGVQPLQSEEYIEIEWGDDELYHIVTDSNVLSFLPMVGDMVSRLEVEPKNVEGEIIAVEDFNEFVVHRGDGTELKVWQTVIEYTASQPELNGTPHVPEYYIETSDRINRVWSFPYLWIVYIILIITSGGIVIIVYRRRERKEEELSKED